MSIENHTHPHRRSVKETQGHYGQYDLPAEQLPDGTFKPGFIEEFMADMACVDQVVVLAVDAPIPMAPALEQALLPGRKDVVAAVRRAVAYAPASCACEITNRFGRS